LSLKKKKIIGKAVQSGGDAKKQTHRDCNMRHVLRKFKDVLVFYLIHSGSRSNKKSGAESERDDNDFRVPFMAIATFFII